MQSLTTLDLFPMREDVIKELDNYNLHSRSYVWLLLLGVVAHSEKTGFNTILAGHQGTGKGRAFSLIDVLGCGKGVHRIGGHRSPLQFYSEMYQHQNDLIIIEEAEILQADPVIRSMIREGLYAPYTFEWKSTRENPGGTPAKFAFNGSACFGTNCLEDTTNPHVAATYDRFFVCNIQHTDKQIREKQKHRREYKPDMAVMRAVGARIKHIREGKVKVTLDDQDHAVIDQILDETYMDLAGNIPDVYSGTKSVRDQERLEKIVLCTKELFGRIDDEHILNLIRRTYYDLGVQPRNKALGLLLANHGRMRYSDLAEEIAVSSNVKMSKRTAYRRIKELIAVGKITVEGKDVVIN